MRIVYRIQRRQIQASNDVGLPPIVHHLHEPGVCFKGRGFCHTLHASYSHNRGHGLCTEDCPDHGGFVGYYHATLMGTTIPVKKMPLSNCMLRSEVAWDRGVAGPKYPKP